MSEEEKKDIEYLEQERAYAHKFNNRKIITIITIALKLIRNQQKELNSLKEIEQQHKTDNGLLRQELDMQIEHNKELEVTLKQTQDSWFEDTQKLEQEKASNKFDEGLYGLLMKEKEKNKELEEKLKIAVAILTKGTYPEENEGDNDFDKYFISKEKIKGMINYREFELQQEYKEFEEDVEWRTYKKILEV